MTVLHRCDLVSWHDVAVTEANGRKVGIIACQPPPSSVCYVGGFSMRALDVGGFSMRALA
ncbi:hypothetical protein E4L95_08560 [Paracoccus liaowanqingii]|uniref:Uncharacterized protein n=1 Tax=Paracoccus liaowanqingii TaxID=2560053 RepID=A0A4Z1CA61_9RHOB|nr:hypothetical protein E4L95_08560 [Paracoccus liaowanqingii]